MRCRRIAAVLWAASFVAALCASPARAQEITGTITGTVFDSTGAALPGATVSVKSLDTGVTRDFQTTETGRYTAAFLTVGAYELTVSLAGFQPYTAKGIAVHVNDRLEIDATLSVGQLTDVVEVTAAAQLVQPLPAVQTLMGPTQVEELPLNNRNFVQLASLVPGVNSSLADEVGIGLTSTVSMSFAGARRNAINWLVDGASNVDVGSNVTLLSTPSLESIEEFKIITSSYGAEWPRSGGGIVNVVTKSGTNQWRGSAYEFFRNDGLNANSFFRKQVGCTAGSNTCTQTPSDLAIRENPARLRYNNFGYTIGGPIKKDSLFFFFSQEFRRISRVPVDANAAVVPQAWLNDPTNANYVAPALRDANAVRLLGIWPQPNLGVDRFVTSRPNDQNTRQEVARVDWHASPKWRFMARYTHDLSETTEAGGLFFNTLVPDVATTLTDVPGQIFVGQAVTTISSGMLNEFSYQFSSNAISSVYGDNARNKRGDFGLTIPELFPENREGLIPQVTVTGLALIGANQLFDNAYKNHTFVDNLTWQRGNHTWKTGFALGFESKRELSTSVTQGAFTFGAGGGRTAFQNFLTGNRDGACGAACFYTEAEREIGSDINWKRYEVYLQDSWRVRPNVTLDVGVRYGIYPGVTDKNNLLTNFVPELFSAAAAPRFSSPAGTALVVGSGNFLNGIVVAGQNSPHGDAIYPTDKGNVQPRVGFAWDVQGKGRTIVRGGYGIYYDQALVGTFLQNAFVNPPLVSNPSVQNTQLSNPGSGTSPTAVAPFALIATSDPFDTPRTQQWNAGIQRQLYSRGVIDVGYVGSAGDQLIQPVDINQAQPQDVVRLGAVNPARPYQGFAGINRRQTTARARYHGLLVGFRHDAGRAGTLSLAYTLSRTKTDATNDRDALDLPQNPLDLAAEYAIARTDRTHVFTANWVYELPFFKGSGGLVKGVLGGWQVSGIAQLWSGLPISRVVNGTTNGSRRGIRVNQVSDPFANLPANRTGAVYWFNPAAFAPPADGQYGNTGRAIFRLPGVNQWDITLSKNFYPSKSTRLQFRADLINAFNHTQLDPLTVQNTCVVAVTATSCEGSTGNFGAITGTRAPREIQLGLRLSWN
jgi:hypothetical protein